MEKKSQRVYRQYPAGFQKDALERMKHCDDIRALAAELGVSRGVLYLWKRKAEGLPAYGKGSVATEPDEQARKIRQLETKVASLEGELGRRSLESSFFRSALRRVEALRRENERPGGTPSTTKSAAGRSRKAK
jgi:transposase-like protein